MRSPSSSLLQTTAGLTPHRALFGRGRGCGAPLVPREDEVSSPAHAGSIPLRLQAGREALANANHGSGPHDLSEVVWAWCICRILAFLFGLRRKEVRSAHLLPTSDWRIIHISFHPKGDPSKPRQHAYRYAFGVLGQFLFWPRFYSRFVGCRTLEPRFDSGSLASASSMDLSAVAPQSCRAASDILSLPTYGIDPELCGRLRITPHSDHGTISDVIRTYGSGLGYDVQTDCLVAGHWSGSAPSHGAEGSSAPRPSARARCDAARTQRDSARSMAMVARYGDQCVHDEGPQTIWRALSPAFLAIRANPGGWQSISPESGWQLARQTALDRQSQGLLPWLDPVPPFSPIPPDWPSSADSVDPPANRPSSVTPSPRRKPKGRS